MILEYLEAGQIVGTHGCAGEMRVQPWCNSPDFLTRFKTFYLDKNGTGQVSVRSCRAHKNIALLKICGTDSIESAEKMRGKVLYIRRDDANIPEGEWFVQELIGCKAYDADSNELLGELTDVSKTGANDVWHIKNERGEFLVPAIKSVVIDVDVSAEKVVLRPIKGIFDE